MKKMLILVVLILMLFTACGTEAPIMPEPELEQPVHTEQLPVEEQPQVDVPEELEEPEVPEEPTFDITKELRAIRGTVSAADNTVTITVTPGKTMTGVYNTTTSGATVEIKDANGTFADRTDGYVAYKVSNTSNIEGTMVVTLADGTVYEYNVIFDLGL